MPSRQAIQGKPRSRFHSASRRPPAVLEQLLNLIRAEGLGAGDRLPNIRELAGRMHVKPTLVRDALLQAQTMGLVRILPRSGAFIQTLTYAPLVDVLANTIGPAVLQADHNLFHLLDARRVLEIELAGRAAERRRLEDLLPIRQLLDQMARLPDIEQRREYVDADVRLHAEIARLAGNAVLAMFQQSLLGLLKPYLSQLLWTAERRARTAASHADIYAALVNGDPQAARAAMREHLNLAYESLLDEVQSLPPATPGEPGT